MTTVLLLVAPSANRVYAADAPRLLAAEASALLGAFGSAADAEVCTIAGVRYVAVEQPVGRAGEALAHLSAAFAAFESVGNGLMRPVELPEVAPFSDDLVTIPKYQGKTNEQWTRLCLNVTVAATRWPGRLLDRELVVFDPMCGRGTTLNLATMLGLNAVGVDIDRKDFAAYELFIKTWLRRHRLKHHIEVTSVRSGGEQRGEELTLRTAPDKAAFKAGDLTEVRYLRTDTTRLNGLIRKASVDVIVTDTPYGVQHGSHGERLDRSPIALLGKAIPGWADVLRTGGAIGLSINRHVAPVAELHALLERHGLEPIDHGEEFRHRVDSSIDRDLVVARKA